MRRVVALVLLICFVSESMVLGATPPTGTPAPAPLPEQGPQERRAAPPRPPRRAELDALRHEHRSATTAVLMSAVVPGWGQLYADVPFWSALAFTVQMYYLGSLLMERRRVERARVLRDREPVDSPLRETRTQLVDEHKERARDFIWWSSGALLVIALDAYVSVELADFDSPYPPTPDLDRDWGEDEPAGEGLSLRLHFGF